MSFELPIDALFPQIGSDGDQIDAGKGNVGMAATGKIIVTEGRPEAGTTRQLQNSLWWIFGQGSGTEGTAKNAHEHEGSQDLTMDLGQVAGEWVEVLGFSKIGAVTLSDQRVGRVVILEGGEGGGGCRSPSRAGRTESGI